MGETISNKKSKNSFKIEWFRTQFKILRKIFTEEEFSNEELRDYLLQKYNARYIATGRFYNNNTHENKMMTIEGFINYFLNNDYILTGYNVLVKNQYENMPTAIEALNYILSERKFYKKKMEAAPKASDEYILNKVIQLTYKILANSYYGIVSMEGSIFYNPHIQNSITMTAQDLISTAIYLVEAFVANNERFKSFDEIVSFVSNTIAEDYEIEKYLSNIKTFDDVKQYLIDQSDFTLSDNQLENLDIILKRLSVDELNKIYYKNKLLEIFENEYFGSKLKEMCLSGEINDTEFRNLVVTICNYNHIAWDRFLRISKQKRKASIVTDTDSTFIYLGRLIPTLQTIVGDDSAEVKQNILNLLIYILTEALAKTFWTFTGNCNIPDEFKPIINMKNEFIYQRILTTKNKKNYAGWLLSELGKPITDPGIEKHLDIKGLSIRKSTVNKTLRDDFQNLLVNDILLPEKIDIIKVMKDYNEISDYVSDSIRAGKTEFLLPKAVKGFNEYKKPASVEQVKASIIWNALEKDNPIIPPDNVNILKISAKSKDSPTMVELQKTHPDKYEEIVKTVFDVQPGELNLSSNGFSSIALPLDLEEIPEYLRPMVNYDLMVNSNIKNANILLESLGLYCSDDTKQKTNYKSNIVEWL